MDRIGALEGITVLDLTRVLAGPFASMMMADMGANVIKIEETGKGADERQMGPFLNGESAYYMNLNRNKKGMTLNLKSPKGKQIFKDLVKKADVVLENYRPGTMEKLGLGYETLKEVNPAIIYAAVSGFGQYGPYTKRPGYDIISQAMSGLMATPALVVALAAPSWQLAAVLALAYGQLLIATDTVRLYQWAAPTVAIAATSAVEPQWWPVLIALTVFNPLRGDGV